MEYITKRHPLHAGPERNVLALSGGMIEWAHVATGY